MSDCKRKYHDLEDRLSGFAAATCRIAKSLQDDPSSRHISRQLVRSATSPAANYAKARASESRRDFVHKCRLCLKELRESNVWLDLIRRLELTPPPAVEDALLEVDELISIFVASVRTAEANISSKN